MGSAAVAKLHSDPVFRAQLDAARLEVARVRASGLRASGDCVGEAVVMKVAR
jgi:acid phosphatase (class A)